jgi:pyridoxamine 5'-phosphate oxidase
MSIADIRREYNLAGLRREDLDADPLVQFQKWFAQEAGERGGSFRRFFVTLYKSLLLSLGTETLDMNSMTLATVDKEGRPSARVVLLKGLDGRGFTFFTNYDSRNGRELAGNPNAALVVYWADQERQVCVAGEVSKLPAEESEAYFKSRPRGSRIAALVSRQSEPVAHRKVLEEKWQQLEAQYPGDVPRPENWGGYVLKPSRIEFWQGRPNRLHDRFQYTRGEGNAWKIERLSP